MNLLSECWEWNGTRNKHGYGVKNLKLDGAWRSRLTHRIAYEWANGPVPNGMHVLHRCDNPPCCNPAHLFVGTQRDNVEDAIRKGRFDTSGLRPNLPPRKQFCARGHAFTPANTIVKPGGRSCRTCANETQRLRRARNGNKQ